MRLQYVSSTAVLTPLSSGPLYHTPPHPAVTVPTVGMVGEKNVTVTRNPLSTLHFSEASIPTGKSSEKIDMNATVTSNSWSTPNSANPPVWDSRDETNATVTSNPLSTPYFSKTLIPTVKGVEQYL